MKKILITENQFRKLIENILIEQDHNDALKQYKKISDMRLWFYENIVNKSKEILNPKSPNYIYYVDKNTGYRHMDYNKKTGYLWVDRPIWLYFKSNYSHNNKEIQELIKDLMGEAYGLSDVTSFIGIRTIYE